MRRILIVVVLILAALVVGLRLGRSPADQPASVATEHSIDWAQMQDRDLHVAALFLYARAHGPGRAIDSLDVLVHNDSSVRALGPSKLHQIAHTLGWRSAPSEGEVVRVFRECPPHLGAGCMHGVIEAVVSQRHHVDSEFVAGYCATLVAPGAAPQVVYECSHGLGHGISQQTGHNLLRVLRLCDAITTPNLRRECHDGAFMENVVHGVRLAQNQLGPPSQHVHGTSNGESTAPDTAFLNPGKPNYPCDVIMAAYRASCWAYQSILLLALNNNDLRRTLAACAAAREHEQECYAGFGKQAMGLTPNEPQPAVTACRAANPQWLASCIGGIVEYYTSFSWRADETVSFCRILTTSEKTSCYAALGSAMGRMRPTAADAEAECAKSEPQFVASCRGATDAAAKPKP